MNPSLPAGVFTPRRKRPPIWLLLPVLFLVGLSLLPVGVKLVPVSYTHLTLPTSDLV